MEIYLLRHGIAEEGVGVRDPERALTAEGKRKLRDVLKVAGAADMKPSLIISSPYKRAQESAKIAVEILGYSGEVLKCNVLTPDSNPEDVWQEIRVHKNEDSVLLVGHEPLFSSLTGYLLGSIDLQVDFKKGMVVRIDCDRFGSEPRGILRWALTPKLVAGK